MINLVMINLIAIARSNCPARKRSHSIAQSKLERNTEHGLDIFMDKNDISSVFLLKFSQFYTRMYSSHS